MYEKLFGLPPLSYLLQMHIVPHYSKETVIKALEHILPQSFDWNAYNFITSSAQICEDGYAAAETSYKIVVTNSNAQADTYYKASILDTGYEYIIVSNGQALKNNGNGNVVAASPVTVKENNTIDLYYDETEGILWEATAVTHDYGTHTLKNDAIYLYRKTSNSTTTLIGDNSTLESNYIHWRYNGDYLWNGKTTSYYANYDGGWKISTSEPEIKTVLFTARLPRTLYFENADDLTYDLSQGGDFAEPTLVNPDNFDVTFDTSNPNIATVDSEGNVSFNANNVTGKVIVYARVAPNNTYQGAEASYVITVMAPHYYTRVSSVEIGAKYLIVNESSSTLGKVFKPTVSSGAFVNSDNTLDATISNSIILGTDSIDECPFEFESATTSGTYYLKTTELNPNYYLYLSNSKMTASESNPGINYVFKLTFTNDGIVTLKRNSSNYYISYVNGNFQYSGSASGNIALYKYVTGIPKQAQTISFDGEDETVTLGTTYQIGSYVALHGIQQSEGHSAVSYDTSDHDVAVVELVDDTYKVKLVGAGTTDIIVTAAETNTYYSATATYQLTINKGTQTIAYSPANAEPEYDLASSNWNVALPTLDVSGVKTQVVFESSNTNVATVSDQGVVSLVAPITKGATATITATAIESDNYEEASASFTLKVVDSNAQPSVYNKVTSADDLDINAKYLVVYESGSKVFKPFLTTSGTSFSKSTNNVVGVTIASNQITSDALGECEMTLESGYYLYVDAEGRYIYPVSSSGGNTFEAESTKSHALTITFSNGIASIKNSSYYFYYSTNSTWFSTTSTAGSVNTALYKLDDGQPKDRNLAFSKDEITVSIYGKTEDFVLTNAPVLSGKKLDDVTYSSSNPNVATVNATTGEVTIKRVEGTAIITASALATPSGTTPAYLADETSYTITVVDEKPYYKKVTSTNDLPTGSTSASGNYLFVYEDNVNNKAYVFKATIDVVTTAAGNTSSNNFNLVTDNNAVEVDLTDNGIEATETVSACKMMLQKHSSSETWNIFGVFCTADENSYWLRINTSTAKLVAMTGAGYSSTFTFAQSSEGNNLTLQRIKNGETTTSMVFDTTNLCFIASTTSSNIALYMMDE